MNREFKILLAPFIFEGKTFVPHLVNQIKGWPEVEHQDEYAVRPEIEPLNSENVRVMEQTDTTLTICCGHEGSVHKVVIAFENAELVIESCETIALGGYVAMMDMEEFEESFVGIEVGKRPMKPRSAWAWQMELDKAIASEDYEEASKIKERMDEAKRNEHIQ